MNLRLFRGGYRTRAAWPSAAALLCVSLATALPARAQDAEPAPPEEQPEGAPPEPAPPEPAPEEAPPPAQPTEAEDEAAADQLIGELLASEGEEADDLRWLYSDVEEYAPSDLVGRPIPAPGLPSRGEGSRRTWNPRWRRFGVFNYILTGAGFATAGASSFIQPAADPWRSRNSFDESVRDAIGIEDYDTGQWGRDLSDVLLSVSIAYPLLVDSLIVMTWYRRSSDVGGQMALITAQAMAFGSAVHGLTAGFASRERPYVRNCGTTIDPDLSDCRQKRRFRSYFSGHATVAFATASASCSHHIWHRVYGDPVADALSCTGTLFTAGMVATMRIVGDQHYVTDVATGAAVGTLSGLALPWLLHYGPIAEVEGAGKAAALRLNVVPMPSGLGVTGVF